MIHAQNWSPFILLLIDVQADFWEPATADAYPDFPENTANLLAFCRRTGLDILHLRASFRPDRSDWMARYKLLGKIPCVAGTAGAEVLPCAQAEPGEPIIYKQSFDGFLQPELPHHLEENGKRFVLVAGIESSVCVLLTAMAATQRGYLTAIVSDCCADNRPAHEHTMGNYRFAFDTVNHADILASYARWRDDLAALERAA